jgi:hypothetical protein
MTKLISKLLKGQCHEIFNLRFFSSNNTPWVHGPFWILLQICRDTIGFWTKKNHACGSMTISKSKKTYVIVDTACSFYFFCIASLFCIWFTLSQLFANFIVHPLSMTPQAPCMRGQWYHRHPCILCQWHRMHSTPFFFYFANLNFYAKRL